MNTKTEPKSKTNLSGPFAPPGYRNIGIRKLKLVSQADALINKITAAGINMKHMKKLYGINKSPLEITTKEWTGVISELKDFARSNGVEA